MQNFNFIAMRLILILHAKRSLESLCIQKTKFKKCYYIIKKLLDKYVLAS